MGSGRSLQAQSASALAGAAQVRASPIATQVSVAMRRIRIIRPPFRVIVIELYCIDATFAVPSDRASVGSTGRLPTSRRPVGGFASGWRSFEGSRRVLTSSEE
ncbi:hypothetical protein Jiend_01080 [Micromonospora endophytica]|nr:hypothetical protein Jiend_01080 [Micromonospora endophytica]